MAKRKRGGNDQETYTPKKSRPGPQENDSASEAGILTPSKQTPSRSSTRRDPPSQKPSYQAVNGTKSCINGIDGGVATPKSARRVLFSTPSKLAKETADEGTPTIVRNADRSARRKSARRIIERAIAGDSSDDEAQEEEDILARQIWDEDENEEEELGVPDESAVPETPSKRGRGRPKGKTKIGQRKRSPTPPQNLPSHEQYFWQNRPGGAKTSNNTLSSVKLLNHEEYFTAIQSCTDPHEESVDYLHTLHARSFPQWSFELREGFNICLYGYGSKRLLVDQFATFIHDNSSPAPEIIIINGYIPSLTLRELLITLANALLPPSLTAKLPSQPQALLSHFLSSLTANPPERPAILLLNSIDAAPLRRATTQSLITSLASHPSLSLVATADTPTFPLLWDISQAQQLRFLFHDSTTFVPFSAELDPVDTVNELLGRAGRKITGRDGVAYVLRSLPENARSLFRVLLEQQLAGGVGDPWAEAAELGGGGAEDARTRRGMGAGSSEVGVEYRFLYHKAVESFICSSEMGFRTLLKEFHDHQMVETRRDATGGERLVVPFRREELEALIEELGGVVL